MRTVEIDDEVYAAIQRHAVPLEDDANSVLRRLLLNVRSPVASTYPHPGPVMSRAAGNDVLPWQEFVLPLLEALIEMGGRAQAKQVVAAMEPKLAGRLRPADYERLATGAIRWHNRAHFVRLELVRSGALAKGPFGIWEITPDGRSWVQRKTSQS